MRGQVGRDEKGNTCLVLAPASLCDTSVKLTLCLAIVMSVRCGRDHSSASKARDGTGSGIRVGCVCGRPV